MNTENTLQEQDGAQSALDDKARELVKTMRIERIWDDIDRKPKPDTLCPVTFNSFKRKEFAHQVALAVLKAQAEKGGAA